MNDKRRQMLRRAIDMLDAAETVVSAALDQEQDSLDNMPENLENSERYEILEYNIGKLEEAVEGITEASACISDAIE